MAFLIKMVYHYQCRKKVFIMSRSRRNFGAKYTTNCAIQLLKGEKEHNVRNAKNDTQQDFHCKRKKEHLVNAVLSLDNKCEDNLADKILMELQKLESLSPEYKTVLRLISKRLRNDLWMYGKNDIVIYEMLCTCGKQLQNDCMVEGGKYTEELLTDYVWYIKAYSNILGVALQPHYFDKFVSDIRLENARVIVEKQWDDILGVPENSDKKFIEIFDDVFSNCLEKYDDAFFYSLSEKDILCRAVPGWRWDEKRFIPWDNRSNVNRWNPPGKTYLYLSFEKQEKRFSDKLSINEYICLEECRAQKGDKYSFCNFSAVKGGKILDLSYNDVEYWKYLRDLEKYGEKIKKSIVTSILSDPEKIKEMGTTNESTGRYLKRHVDNSAFERDFIEINTAKQYLKLVCNAIYKKVDENDNSGKMKAYKSFHILAQYLEKKGITGIIYPCTRTKKIVGKNLVLFNKNDAKPIAGSIREIVY